MRFSTALLSLFLVFNLYAQHDGHHQKPMTENKGEVQKNCPVMKAVINKKMFSDYKGKRIYFCCQSCIDEFKKNPEKYISQLENNGVLLEKISAK